MNQSIMNQNYGASRDHCWQFVALQTPVPLGGSSKVPPKQRREAVERVFDCLNRNTNNHDIIHLYVNKQERNVMMKRSLIDIR